MNLSGQTPAVCGALLFLRHGMLALAMSALLAFGQGLIPAGSALALTIMSQSAMSIVGTKILDKEASKNPNYTADIGFDLLGYSFPLTTLLTASACILGDVYLKNLHWVGLTLLGAGGALSMKNGAEFRDPKTWSK